MKLTQTFATVKLYSLISLISFVSQLLLTQVCKYYRFYPSLYIYHLSKRSLIKHTCSWSDKLFHYEQWTDKRKCFYVYAFFMFFFNKYLMIPRTLKTGYAGVVWHQLWLIKACYVIWNQLTSYWKKLLQRDVF